jgi:adenylate cyclase
MEPRLPEPYKSEDFVEARSGDRLGFVVLSIDIVGSTAIATSEHGDAYHRLIVPTFLFELSEIVPLFNGFVLKYAGDGLIAYFPEPSFMRKNDLALDCALTMRGLVHRALNPELLKRGLPELEIRIGIDAGNAYVEVIGSPSSKRHADIVGAVVSLASKIQAKADTGGISLGETAVQHLHTAWRQWCEVVEPSDAWPYKNRNGDPYRYYRYLSPSQDDSTGSTAGETDMAG